MEKEKTAGTSLKGSRRVQFSPEECASKWAESPWKPSHGWLWSRGWTLKRSSYEFLIAFLDIKHNNHMQHPLFWHEAYVMSVEPGTRNNWTSKGELSIYHHVSGGDTEKLSALAGKGETKLLDEKEFLGNWLQKANYPTSKLRSWAFILKAYSFWV